MSRTHSQTRIFAFAGPKGGIGRTTCAVTLAKAIALRDKKVLFIDLSNCSETASFLDLPSQSLQDFNHPVPVLTAINGLEYLCTTPDDIDDFCTVLHDWNTYDFIVLDLLSGFDVLSCDLFLRADYPLLVIDPEPASIQITSKWLHFAFIRYVERFEENDELSSRLKALDENTSFISFFNSLSEALQNSLLIELGAFRCALMLNRKRDNSEALQSIALAHAWGMRFGFDIRFIGSLSHDDRRWFFSRNLADVSCFMHEDPLVREMDDLCREKLFTLQFESRPCLPLINLQAHAKDFLRVDSSAQARQMFRLLWEGYRRENGLVSNVLDKSSITDTITKLETAYRFADDTNGNEHTLESHSMTRQVSTLMAAAKSIDTEKQQLDAGSWLAKARKDAHLSVLQLAMKTRIPSKIIEKIEAQELEHIPPARLHAYFFEIANTLSLNFDEIKSKFGL